MVVLILISTTMPCAAIINGDDKAESLLQRAESVRSSDPEDLKLVLAKLNEEKSSLTLQQGEHVKYLEAYADAFDGHYALATEQAQQLIDSSSNTDIQYRARSLVVNVYALERRFAEALRELEQVLAMADGVGDATIKHQGLGAATTVYNQVGQYKTAVEYADRIIADEPEPRSRCFAMQARLEAMEKLHLLPIADSEILSAVSQCAGIGELAAANTVRMTMVRKWNMEGKRAQGIAFLNRYMDEIEGTHYPYLISEVHALLAEMLMQQGDISGAEHHANISVAQEKQIDFSTPVVQAYKTLFDISMLKGDSAKSLAWYQKYAEADKAYLTEVRARETAYQIVRQETLQKSQQIALLDKNNQVLKLQQRVNEQQQSITRMMFLMLLLIVGLIGFWAYRIKRSHMSLRHLAEVDALTGICNRHHFSQLSEQLLEQSAKAGDDVALVMFDLDHFKSINDRFGHDTGDWVLQRVADTCKGFCRRIDYLGRLGGEEFAILLAGCDLRAATRVAEDCRVRLASIDTQPSGHKFVITASFGITASSLSSYGLAKMLSHADQALYRAKRAGRNRVCAYDGEPPQWTQAHVVAIEGHAVPATSAGQDSAT